MATIGGSDILPVRSSKSRNDSDNEELARLGKKSVLKKQRNFGFLSMLGFSCTVMITWEGLLVAPTAGGQYHWVSILAPRSSQKFLSYTIGWLTMIGWQAIVASGGFLSASLIQGLLVMNNSSYIAKQWQLVLLYWAIIAFSIVVNTVISVILPKIEGAILIIHTVGFFAILVPLVYWAPHNDASEVFTLFLNGGGWETQGLSFFVGIIGPVFCLLGKPCSQLSNRTEVILTLLGADSAIHSDLQMSEEIVRPSVNVPRAMVFSIVVNGALGLGMLLAILFCLGDVEAIESRTTLPLISIALTATISILLSLIGLGSLVAFNDVVSISINGLYTSYLIGNSLLLYRRLKNDISSYSPTRKTLTNTTDSELTWGPWRIPEPFGSMINILGCIYLTITLVFSFFPSKVNPSPAEMNYSALMTGSVSIFAVLFYLFQGKHIYKGPVVEVELQ
ncbi:GABA permease protein [Rutstroemia sp. NJR-2017a BVV2]|nr:GABA permease protein [Rutstroemia sp. NJR-2017a BVV2]